MELSADLIYTLHTFASGPTDIVSLSEAKWEKQRETLEKTHCLIGTTLNMVVLPLGDLSSFDAAGDFLRATSRPDNRGTKGGVCS
jgi:hypothetical protein